MLMRAIWWTDMCLEYKADPRQVECLLEGLSLGGDSKPTATPGLRALVGQLVDDWALPGIELTGIRGQTARANYFSDSSCSGTSG